MCIELFFIKNAAKLDIILKASAVFKFIGNIRGQAAKHLLKADLVWRKTIAGNKPFKAGAR